MKIAKNTIDFITDIVINNIGNRPNIKKAVKRAFMLGCSSDVDDLIISYDFEDNRLLVEEYAGEYDWGEERYDTIFSLDLATVGISLGKIFHRH